MNDMEESGVVKSLRKDGKSVCITVELDGGPQDAWLDLAENVKPQYIKTGSKCKFKYVENPEGNPLLVYIKCEQSENNFGGFKPGSFPKKSFTPYKKEEKSPEEILGMNRMSALKASSLIYSGSGKEKEFKKLTDEIIEYIKGGNWNEKEFVEKSKLPIAESEDNY